MPDDPTETWMQLRDQVRTSVAEASLVSVRIPEWDPVSLDEGLSWAEHRVMNGWFVRHRTETGADGSATVWFKYWEFGDTEPPWTAA